MSHRAEQDVLEALQRCGVGDEPRAVSIAQLVDVSGWSRGSVQTALSSLQVRGVLVLVRLGSGPHASTWRIPRQQEQPPAQLGHSERAARPLEEA